MPDPASELISGYTAPGFEALRDAFQQNFAAGLEVGASLCVEHRSERVVDLWGGYRDLAVTERWHPDTLINVYSTTKGIAAAAFALLVEDGLVAFSQPVAELWPELIAGRSGLTIGDLLAHRGGLCGFREALDVTDLYDWAKIVDLLSRQEPYWAPGTAAGYHAVSWGYLPGELVLRLTGHTLGSLLHNRISRPLGADFYLGLPASEDHRVAALIGPNRARRSAELTDQPQTAGPLHEIALHNPVIRPYQDAFSLPWRRAEIAASNGHASARGVARIYGALVSAEAADMLSPATMAELLAPRVESEVDLVLGQRLRRGAGVILNFDGMFGPEQGAWGHPGAGGSLGFADPVNQLGFGYVMNQMLGGALGRERTERLLCGLYQSIEALES